jgi:hypothetical protein
MIFGGSGWRAMERPDAPRGDATKGMPASLKLQWKPSAAWRFRRFRLKD